MAWFSLGVILAAPCPKHVFAEEAGSTLFVRFQDLPCSKEMVIKFNIILAHLSVGPSPETSSFAS